jgi:hypothetical protein
LTVGGLQFTVGNSIEQFVLVNTATRQKNCPCTIKTKISFLLNFINFLDINGLNFVVLFFAGYCFALL